MKIKLRIFSYHFFYFSQEDRISYLDEIIGDKIEEFIYIYCPGNFNRKRIK